MKLSTSTGYLTCLIFTLFLYIKTSYSEPIMGSIGHCYLIEAANKPNPNEYLGEKQQCIFAWRAIADNSISRKAKSIVNKEVTMIKNVITTAGAAPTFSEKVATQEGWKNGKETVDLRYAIIDSAQGQISNNPQAVWSIEKDYANKDLISWSPWYLSLPGNKAPIKVYCEVQPYSNEAEIKFNSCTHYHYNAKEKKVFGFNPNNDTALYDNDDELSGKITENKKENCSGLIAEEAAYDCATPEEKKLHNSPGTPFFSDVKDKKCVNEKTSLLNNKCAEEGSDGKEKSLCSCSIL